MGDLDLLFSKSSLFATLKCCAGEYVPEADHTHQDGLGGERVADVEGLEGFVFILHPLGADLYCGVSWQLININFLSLSIIHINIHSHCEP